MCTIRMMMAMTMRNKLLKETILVPFKELILPDSACKFKNNNPQHGYCMNVHTHIRVADIKNKVASTALVAVGYFRASRTFNE